MNVCRSGMLAIALVLAGCTTATSYIDPTGPDIATVTGTKVEREAFDWDDFFPLVIDGRYTYRKGVLFGGTNATPIPMSPGGHKLVIEALFMRGLGQRFEAYVPLNVQLLPTHKYRVRGIIKDNLAEVWLDDETTGAKNIAIGSGTFSRRESGGAGVPIPIFIPRGR